MKRLFYVYRKVIFNISFSKASRLLSEAPLCEQCFGYSIHWPMIGNICYVTLHRCGHHDINRRQIVQSPTRNSRAFLRLQKSNLVNCQDPMANSVAVALSQPVHPAFVFLYIMQNCAKASPSNADTIQQLPVSLSSSE